MLDKLIKSTKHLYPSGRAFKLFSNNNIGRLHKALAQSEKRVYDELFSVYDSLLPDNFNFTLQDAENWEIRLGLPVSPNVSLTQRKLNIQRKYAHPGRIRGRQTVEFFNFELEQAGFTNLRAYRNDFNGQPKRPSEAFANMHGARPHGGFAHGSSIGEVVIDYLEPQIDYERYTDFINSNPSNVTEFLKNTFYIANTNFEFAEVDAARGRQLRKLILEFLPANMICFLQIKYIA
jgi:hypothetical protein